MSVVSATAALATAAGMTVTASAGPDLWAAYLTAQQAAGNAWLTYRMMRQAGGTDGTAGRLYGQAYEAQQASDAAYEAWRQAQHQVFPGAGG